MAGRGVSISPCPYHLLLGWGFTAAEGGSRPGRAVATVGPWSGEAKRLWRPDEAAQACECVCVICDIVCLCAYLYLSVCL